jgi:aminoglycoside/choline kinase family phosphotransferase
VFTRLLVRDGKPRYLQFMPRVWRLLEGDLEHPALAPVRQWLDTHLPKGTRATPKAPS